MASNTRFKRLIHLVAKFPSGYSSTLEKDLMQACESLPKVSQRIFDFNGKKLHGLRFEPYNGSFAFQFAAAVPGEEASALASDGVEDVRASLVATSPPQGHDFSDGDAICLVSGDNIFACLSVLREGAIGSFLHELFKSLGMDLAQKVAIMHAPNHDTLRILREEGVASINTRTVLNEATLSRYVDSGMGLFGRFLSAFSQEDKSLLFRAAAANPNFSLSFSKSRFSKGADMSWAVEMAQDFIEDDVVYIIKTLKGTIITNTKMCVAKRVKLPRFGKSVFTDEALKALESFKNDILST